jgi:uncharacterized protein
VPDLKAVKLDLTRYRQPLTQVSKRFRPEELEGEREAYRVVEPVELAFDLHKDKDRFRLEGTVRTVLELPCSRCLEPYRLPVDAALDLRYLPVSERSSEDETEVSEEDVDISFYQDDQIDLSELLREQFYLVLPMKPLCQEECRGLCPQCGVNRNTGTCDCGPGWEDPRLAALKGLIKGTS